MTSCSSDSRSCNYTFQAIQQPTSANPQSAIRIPQSDERYRVRVSNTLYGGVEISADSGSTWYLVGRVIKPAVDRAPGAGSELPAVERSSPTGMAFDVGKGHLVRLLPDTPHNRRDPAAIVVNLPSTASFFRDLLPPAGSPVQQVLNGIAAALPAGYSPQADDRLLFSVPKSTLPAERIPELVKDAAERYRDSALARERAAGRIPFKGTLTVNTTAAPGDKLDAVTYMLDGNVVAIQNSPPFKLQLNTRDYANGEHLVEVRGLDANGTVVTQHKELIVVDNS